MALIDISPILSELIAVWPGDTKLQRHVLSAIDQGANIDLSTITTTVHLGAHADAPRHYHSEGCTIDQVDLSQYIGPCYVHTVAGKSIVGAEDCIIPLASGATRVLFRTLSFTDPNTFNTDFTSLSAEAIECLGAAGVVLVGIDTPSVDPFSSKDLPAHQELSKYKMANLEGLVLSHVSDGTYELIALPLALKGFEASPVRAVLRN